MSAAKARQTLSRIRCTLETIDCLRENKPKLPFALCFIAEEIHYGCPKEFDFTNNPTTEVKKIHVYADHSLSSIIIGHLDLVKELVVCAAGEEFSNADGDWISLTKDYLSSCEFPNVSPVYPSGWILIQSRAVDSLPVLEPKDEFNDIQKDNVDGEEHLFSDRAIVNALAENNKSYFSWLQLVEDEYGLKNSKCHNVYPTNSMISAIEKLQTNPSNWDCSCDEQLASFLLVTESAGEGYFSGSANCYIDSVEVSSATELSNNLLDGDPDTYWESDGTTGRHYIRLHMKNGVVVQRLLIGVDSTDDNFMPFRIAVHGKSQSGCYTKLLNETTIDLSFTGNVCILENTSEFYKVIEIKIKECREDGIDCRIHGVKIVSSKHKELGLNRDVFNNSLVRYPKLEGVDKDMLYSRSQALLRFVKLLDSVINYVLPNWDYTVGTFKSLETVRQLLPLSRKRAALIESCLRDSQSSGPEIMPKVFLNRHAAAEHLVNPKSDASAANALFNQKYEQWWECKFIGEGIIDQGHIERPKTYAPQPLCDILHWQPKDCFDGVMGGGFRDSLVDIAEELCPSSSESMLPIRFFVRSPNQLHDSSSVNCDCYVPNRSCLLLKKYEWIGLLMGACLRSKEHLNYQNDMGAFGRAIPYSLLQILSLPPFTWKQLVGETVKWERDYITVDAAEVKLHETLQKIDKQTYNEKFYGFLTFSTVLSDNSIHDIKSCGSEKFVEFDERNDYINGVQMVRMNEFNKQIAAIKQGILRTIPQAVLDLLTWQELEKRVCGDPEICVDALRRSAHYDEISESDVRVKHLWVALEKFSNDDRSRFLRFVTGRRRLPTPLYIAPSKLGTAIDSLPESATCSSMLFCPPYSSAKIAEEKLRYAVYNCVAIDADMNPWEE